MVSFVPIILSSDKLLNFTHVSSLNEYLRKRRQMWKTLNGSWKHSTFTETSGKWPIKQVKKTYSKSTAKAKICNQFKEQRVNIILKSWKRYWKRRKPTNKVYAWVYSKLLNQFIKTRNEPLWLRMINIKTKCDLKSWFNFFQVLLYWGQWKNGKDKLGFAFRTLRNWLDFFLLVKLVLRGKAHEGAWL